jgi:L-fuconolactonase
MFVVDSQVHIWAADAPERPWGPGPHTPHRPEPFSKDDLLKEMDAAGVARAVLVPPKMEGDRNDLVLEAARMHPDRFVAMGRIPADRPESRPLIPTWKEQRGMKGLRMSITGRERPLMTEGKADWLWPEAERAAIPIMVRLTYDLLPQLDLIAQTYPGLKFAIDHLAVVHKKKDAAAFAYLPELLKLAKRPNVSVKLTSLPCYTTDPYPYRNLHGYVRQVYDAFGPQRMFWGTDFTKLTSTYKQAITLFTEELPWLSKTDQELILGKALCEWLEWPLPPNA